MRGMTASELWRTGDEVGRYYEGWFGSDCYNLAECSRAFEMVVTALLRGALRIGSPQV